MKINPWIAFLLLAITAGSACKRDAGSAGTADGGADSDGSSEAIAFEWREFKRESASCKTDSNFCATISARYPEVVAGPPAVQQAINDTIGACVRLSLAVFALGPEEVPADLETIAQQFIEEYEALTTAEAGFTTPWSAELEGRVLYQSEKFISIELSTYSYAGGAHPNYFSFLLAFDARNAEELLLEDLVRDTMGLLPLAKAAFRTARGLPAQADLAEEGFFWGGDFQFPENIAPVEEGLYFFYNPYEVAAYVFGPTEFVIPWEQLRPLLMPGVLD